MGDGGQHAGEPGEGRRRDIGIRVHKAKRCARYGFGLTMCFTLLAGRILRFSMSYILAHN